jgi:hypothetical protein
MEILKTESRDIIVTTWGISRIMTVNVATEYRIIPRDSIEDSIPTWEENGVDENADKKRELAFFKNMAGVVANVKFISGIKELVTLDDIELAVDLYFSPSISLIYRPDGVPKERKLELIKNIKKFLGMDND